MQRAFRQVDVFTDRLGYGNPVAVVLDAEGLTTDQMSRFAQWTNLSETTFVLPPTDAGADYRVRIFTPTRELPFAGHPTIGTCHAWAESVSFGGDAVVQECGAGLIRLRRTGGQFSFETPPLTRSGPLSAAEIADVAGAVGVSVDEVVDAAWLVNGPPWAGLLINNVDRLRELTPDFAGRDLFIGVAALCTDEQAAVEVRAFFEAGGVREDPVTGSLNGALGQWLLGSGTLSAPYIASQGTSMGRDGRVTISQFDGGIWVGGHAVTGIAGTVTL